jgi:putative transposase
MTMDRMALKSLLEKGSDHDLLWEMIAFVTSRMMNVEVERLTNAAHGERSADRAVQRNGYRTRDWHTGAGTVPVAIPKLRVCAEHGFAMTARISRRSWSRAVRPTRR